MLYENVCTRCVPGATSKEQLKEEELSAGEHPVIYVGEISRSILERAKEHWAGCVKKKEDNHMYRHQSLVHGGEPVKFTMRVVGSHQSALSRQVSEAVRIRRRGGLGSILNSKSEYNRCHITRLRGEEKEEQELREQEMNEEEVRVGALLDGEQREWEQHKTRRRDKERRGIAKAGWDKI